LTASDSFVLSRNTNLVASQGFASGRQESWGNTFLARHDVADDAPGLPESRCDLRRAAFQRCGLDSNTYGLQSHLDHPLTPRLTGNIGYGFTYLDVRGQESSTTHAPTLGVSYRLTPTLTGSVSGGPAITQLGGETFMSPGATASLVRRYDSARRVWQYTRAVGARAGFGGTTDTQSASGTLTLSTWQRGLLVVFSPAYSIAESVGRGQAERVDVRALTVNLGVTYQLARFVSVFGGYTFFQAAHRGVVVGAGRCGSRPSQGRSAVRVSYQLRLTGQLSTISTVVHKMENCTV